MTKNIIYNEIDVCEFVENPKVFSNYKPGTNRLIVPKGTEVKHFGNLTIEGIKRFTEVK